MRIKETMIKAQILPESTRPTPVGGFHFNDWNLPEEKQRESDSVLFEGKIIARMPDLGSTKKISFIEESKRQTVVERTEPSSKGQRILSRFREKMTEFVLYIHSVIETRKKLSQCIAACGGAIVLCGMVILFLEQDKDELPASPVVQHVDADSGLLPEFSHSLSAQSADRSLSEPAFSPMIVSEAVETATTPPPVSSVPIADASALTSLAAEQVKQGTSVWDRPDTDSYSPWSVASRQSEILRSPPPSHFIAADPIADDPIAEGTIAVALAAPDAARPGTSVDIPSEPITLVTMTPLHSSMPFSPHERHLAAQSFVPPNNTYSSVPIPSTDQPPASGMIPMHDRLEYTSKMTAPQNDQQSVYASPQQYLQDGMMPSSAQMGSTQRSGSSQNFHDQYNRYPLYTGPNIPIPSGPSTLSQSAGYYPQQQMHGYGQEMNPERGFYSPPPTTYRRY